MKLTLDIGPLAHGGHCVARTEVDGKRRTVLVRHTAPGEKVAARITARRAKVWYADAEEVLEPSPHRVASCWPEAGPGGVGGGELAHLAVAYQRQLKAEVVRDALRRVGSAALAETVTEQAAAFTVRPVGDGQAQRTRIELTVAPHGRAGMHRYRSHEVLALTEMPLADPRITALELLGDSAWKAHFAPGQRVRAVAPSAGSALVGIEGQWFSAPGQRAAPLVHEVVDAASGSWRYQVAADGFWQVQRGAPAALVDAVLAAAQLQAGEKVLELFAGAGLFSAPLGASVGTGGQVVTLEGARSAVDNAAHNVAGLPVRTLVCTVDPAGVQAAGQLLPGVDVVVLDPPRTGAHPATMAAVAALRPRCIVLVACDPAALARDLEAARVAGYDVESLVGLDLFVHTHHVEVVASLVPRSEQ